MDLLESRGFTHKDMKDTPKIGVHAAKKSLNYEVGGFKFNSKCIPSGYTHYVLNIRLYCVISE